MRRPPHSPFWAKPEAPSAEQVEAEARAAELGSPDEGLALGPDGPARVALLNAEFVRRGCQYRVQRNTGAPPRR